MTTPSEEPLDNANEADVAEQAQDADGAGSVTDAPDDTPGEAPAEANEADVLDQWTEIEEDDGGYPRAE